MLGRVIRDTERKAKGMQLDTKVQERLQRLLAVAVSINSQPRVRADGDLLATQSLRGNPYEGHALKACLEQAQRTSGVRAAQVFVYRGYKGYGCTSDTRQLFISGAKRGITPSLKNKLKRRNAIDR